MSMFFIVKKPPVPPEPEWVSYFDNTYWTAGANTAWDGAKWVESGPGGSIYLYENGSWVEGFRPTKIRITGTYSWASDFSIIDTDSNFIGSASAGALVEFDLTFGGFDIHHATLYGMTNITNIEFFV